MSEVDQADQDRKALEALVVNNPDLERLEALLDRFNIFEAVGLVRQEIRHSAFLAFLLDPRENHGLGDAFTKRLLQEAIMSAPEVSALVTPIELSLWDLGQMEMRREWQHIDVFLLDERNRLAVIIENKIDTTEHSDQLRRYHEIVKQHYPEYRVVGLYLTSAGDDPSHEVYLPLSYKLVCEVLDSLAQSRASVSNTDLQILVTHYTQMLRRHIVGDSEVAKLSQQIYRKHQRALDLIYEHRFIRREEIRRMLETLISENPALVYTHRSTNYPVEEYVHFGFREWDVPRLQTGKRVQEGNRSLLFLFCNWPNKVSLHLQIRPGDDTTRQKLLNVAHANPEVFRDAQVSLSQWTNIFSKVLLPPTIYREQTNSEQERELRECWNEFLQIDLPQMNAVLKNEQWIWESGEPGD